jgi:hypothetical protein
MNQLQKIISLCVILGSSLLLTSCTLLQPKPPNQSPADTTEGNQPLSATIVLEPSTEASFSAELQFIPTETIPLSGLALRLIFPKQTIEDGVNPFIIPETTRGKFWQPLINQVDCVSDADSCYADLALLTLNPSGSDFSGLDQIAGLNPTVFSATMIEGLQMDTANSKATTKKADVIVLELINNVQSN